LGLQATSKVYLEAYGDWNDLPDEGDRSRDVFTLQGFGAWVGKNLRAGLLLSHQVRKNAAGGDPDSPSEYLTMTLVSGFVAKRLGPRATLVARVDRLMDPNPQAGKIPYVPFVATDAGYTFAVAGVDLVPASDVHLIPNVEMVFYDEPSAGERPSALVMPRLTFFFRF
jgi:hypothetical protein